VRKHRIMIVDDDADLVREIGDLLRTRGYDVAEFSDSIEAGHQVGTIMPDLALVDLRMNGRTGFQLANIISHRPETAHIPILAMSGYYDEEKYKGLMQIVGIKECIKKPFTPRDLLREVDKLIPARQERPEADGED
jgi:CheY-like chemotaxis protein